jgi:hypothetical protein
MAPKDKRKRKGFLPKTIGGWIGLAFKIMGAAAIVAPAAQAVIAFLPAPEAIPGEILYRYTGIQRQGGAWDSGQAFNGIGTVAGGVALIYIGKLIGKLIR